MSALDIEGLTVALPPGADRPHALRGVSLRLDRSEILCVVGESGSGKSVMAMAAMRLLAPGLRVEAGRVLLAGTDLLALSEEGMRRVRGRRVAMVFQEPMTALNPLMTVGDQLAEMWRAHTDLPAAEVRARSVEALREVALPDPEGALRAFPHELSGGQRQRAMIAMALALEPEALICDEPTTALDVTTQAQVLALIRDLQRRRGTAVLFITHDFGVVSQVCTKILVMYAGRAAEYAGKREVLTKPHHPYTRGLMGSIPHLVDETTERLAEIPSPHVKMVRGKGLFIGVELKPQAGGARRFCEALQAKGILAKETHEHVIRFAPPLIIDRATIDGAVEPITEVLNQP